MSQTNPVLEAVDIITENKIKNLKFDKTITGNIIDIINKDEGIYRAEYESGTFLVYSEDPNMIYQKGDSIYIKIPEGDYSNKKFIEGKIKINEDTASKIKLSQTLVYSNKIFTSEEINTDLFLWYLNLYRGKYLKISASFSGTADENYGIEINYATSLETFVDKSFDTVSMNGSIFTPKNEIQSKIIQIPDVEEKISSFTATLFVDAIDENKLTVSNITFQFCEMIDFTITPYYLQINQLNSNPLQLQSRLFQQGKEIKGLKYQWYKEIADGIIDVEAGLGWQKLDDKTSSDLEIAEPPEGQIKYKVIIEYAEDQSISAEYQVNPTGKTIGFEEDGFTYSYFDSFGNKIETGNNNQPDERNKYSSLIVKATNGTDIYTLTRFNENAKKIFISGQVVFHYNANSDISATIANKEYVLTPQISSQYNIKSIKWYLTSGLGKEDSLKVDDDNNLIKEGEKYNPHHSMLKNIWLDSNNCIRYSIKDTYSISNYNNIFRLVIETDQIDINNKPIYLYQTQEIFFIKDGQQGTNGSEYCCIVRPVDSTGAYINDEEAIYYNGHPIYLKASVFKNSEEIEDFTVNWNKGSNIGEGIIRIDSLLSFITATITVDQYTLYYHYPIYSTTITTTKLPTYLEVPKYVQYAASGYSPQWYNRVIKYNDTSYIDNNISSVDSGLTQIAGGKLKPISNFKSGATTGSINVDSIKCPIMMYVEYQSNSTIKGWNGTDIKTTDGTIIKNPQVGVGNTEKNFTGLVMSDEVQISQDSSDGGLYGYDNGYNTFGLKADGSAYFDTIEICSRLQKKDNIQGYIGYLPGSTGQIDTNILGIESETNSIAIKATYKDKENEEHPKTKNNITLSARGVITLNAPTFSDINFQSEEGDIKNFQYLITEIQNLWTTVGNLEKQIADLSKPSTPSGGGTSGGTTGGTT